MGAPSTMMPTSTPTVCEWFDEYNNHLNNMFGIPNQHISTQLQPYGRIWTGILTGLSSIKSYFSYYYFFHIILPKSVYKSLLCPVTLEYQTQGLITLVCAFWVVFVSIFVFLIMSVKFAVTWKNDGWHEGVAQEDWEPDVQPLIFFLRITIDITAFSLQRSSF